MITTIAFDLDDTLYDEVDYCKSGFTIIARFLASPPQTLNADRIFDCLWKHFSAGNRTTTFNAACDELGITYNNVFIQKLVQIYRHHIPKIALPNDTRDVLQQLNDKFTLALLTDGFLPAQKLKVQALGIEKYFKCIIYTEELGRNCWKPSTAGFEKMLQQLNAKPENIAYVADNLEKDFIAPNKLGMPTIQLIRPNRIHTQSSQDPYATPKHIIHKITDLPPFLEKQQNPPLAL